MFGNMLNLDLVDKVFGKAYKKKKSASSQSSLSSASSGDSMRNSWRSSVSSIDSLEHLELPRRSKNACLDVKHFESKDIVLSVENNTLILRGERTDTTDGQGIVVRHFSRREILPPDCDTSRIRTQLLRDGIVIVTIPKKPKGGDEAEASTSAAEPSTSTATPESPSKRMSTEEQPAATTSPTKRAKLPPIEEDKKKATKGTPKKSKK